MTPEKTPDHATDPVLRIANCSGFFGDRLAAAAEMVEGGPIDVLTGDWLAELTMLILAKSELKDPRAGFARTFLTQLEEVLGTCLDRGIRIVSNAGGLSPAGCAEAVTELATRLGLAPRVAHVEGDNLIGRIDELRAGGHDLANLDTGESLADVGVNPITANAYLGGFGIVEALNLGADVVITGRVTDAAVVLGPAAWRFGWARDDWDRLAAGVVAGHIIECGTQCTGGNYAFFEEVPGIERCGFPIAEMHADGSFVITKHPGTGGLVSVGTVTAQLLYEIQGTDYANPDVVTRFDTIRLEQQGPDRVLVSGVKGLPAPSETKVAINYLGGHRNTMTFELTGLAIEEKAAVAERTLWSLVPGGRDAFDAVDVRLIRSDRPDPATNDDAVAHLRVSVMDRDEAKVGRAFSNRVVEMALASYPGFYTTSPPTGATTFGVYWPTLVPADFCNHELVFGDERIAIPPAPQPTEPARKEASPEIHLPPVPDGPTRAVPLGTIAGARSGDKGGNANVGVWVHTPEAFAWLRAHLTIERLRELMPAETAGLDVERHELANLLAVNFVVVGLLGRGVAASTRSDPQAKGFGEYLRAKVVDVPVSLLS